MKPRITLIAGARPNFIKIAPVYEELVARNIKPTLVHTGQHYDERMSDLFFRQLEIPEPDINLEVGSASHAVQTAEIMKRFEKLMMERPADLVVVVGDVNSTAACALVSKKLPNIGLAHVEAGLRSGDRSMPEEANRLVTDALSDLLFASEQSGRDNLRAEGVPEGCIHFSGNVMIDTLRKRLDQAQLGTALKDHSVEPQKYALLTMHRPANVDHPAVFEPVMDAIAEFADRYVEVVFPMHPRTKGAFERWASSRQVSAKLKVVPPVGYLSFLQLMASAKLVLTDSGGIQEETTALGVHCLTLRENTERPATITEGTNELVGLDPSRILTEARAVVEGNAKKGRIPELWDGQAAGRIAAVIESWNGEMR